MRKLLIEMEIEVEELSGEDKEEVRSQGGIDDEDEGDYFDPQTYNHREFREIIEAAFHEEAVREAFSGSNMFVTFGSVKVTNSAWEG